MKNWLPSNWKAYLIWAGVTAGILALTALGYRGPGDQPLPLPLPPAPIFKGALPPELPELPPEQDPAEGPPAAQQRMQQQGPPGEPDAHGWVPDPDAVAAVEKGLVFKTFSDTPAGQVGDLPQAVYLWKAYHKLFARGPPEKNQNPVGSCVSFGTNNAIERTMAADIAFAGKAFEFKSICEEVTYAGSRVQVGKGRIGGDGSVGAWAAKFVHEWGIVAREVHGKHDLTKYDPTRCRAWGRSGVPADLLPLCKEHPVQDITRVKSWDEAKKALASGYGIAICSGYGFEGKRDANGVKQPRGGWNHCMALDGYHTEAGKEYGHIENSWGPRPNEGPVGWGEPSTAGFWVTSQVADKMIKSGGDSWAFSNIKGFPARRLDWFVRHRGPLPRPPFDRLTLFARLQREATTDAICN